MSSLNPFKSGRKFLLDDEIHISPLLVVSIPSNQVGSSYDYVCVSAHVTDRLNPFKSGRKFLQVTG